MRARRRWGWSSPNSRLGTCPTESSIRPAGGTGLLGMWKASPNWSRSASSARRARMVAVSRGCAPWCAHSRKGVGRAAWRNAPAIASGISGRRRSGDFLLLRPCARSKGFAIAVEDEKILRAQRSGAREGMLLCTGGGGGPGRLPAKPRRTARQQR